MTKFYVYTYVDQNDVTVYVGKGSGRRATDHLSAAKSVNQGRATVHKPTRFTFWIAEQMRESRPFWIVKVAEKLDGDAAFELEKELIAKYKRIKHGGTLYNEAAGGFGFNSEDAKEYSNRPSTKEKRVAALLELMRNPEYRRKLKAATTVSNAKPYRREQQRVKAIAEWQSSERKDAAKRKAKELWADPVWSAARRAELVARNKANAKPQ